MDTHYSRTLTVLFAYLSTECTTSNSSSRFVTLEKYGWGIVLSVPSYVLLYCYIRDPPSYMSFYKEPRPFVDQHIAATEKRVHDEEDRPEIPKTTRRGYGGARLKQLPFFNAVRLPRLEVPPTKQMPNLKRLKAILPFKSCKRSMTRLRQITLAQSQKPKNFSIPSRKA
ncbi:hypothetical protein TW65_04339 [Stemphylium lycopersici]|nr:hypothetical protein TW65_04339 [Stemphylium lycopersici]